MGHFLIAIVVFAFTGPAFAKLPKPDWVLGSSKLTYHVSYPLKSVEGVSNGAKGKGECKSGVCEFLIAVPVKSFVSGDGNRDNHMLEVTKGAIHPMVVVRVQVNEADIGESTVAKVEVNFAGKAHTYDQVKVRTNLTGSQASVSGVLPLKLTDFAIERPSLLTIKVDDATPVDFEMSWN